MSKQWAVIIIGIAVDILVAIFGVVVKTMPMPITIIVGSAALALILFGVVSLIRGKKIGERIGIRMRGGKGRFRKTKISGQDKAIDAKDVDLDMHDTDIK